MRDEDYRAESLKVGRMIWVQEEEEYRTISDIEHHMNDVVLTFEETDKRISFHNYDIIEVRP